MSCHCSSCSEGFLELTHPGTTRLKNGQGQELSSSLVATPPELAREYAEMLNRAAPKRRPKLMCRDHVAQVGRWFAQGVLVLGLVDIHERAALLGRELRVLVTEGKWVRSIPDDNALNEFARIQVLAHELGHELNRHDERPSPFDYHPEAAADFWAGWLESQRFGSDKELGTVFFATLGCNQAQCSHPRSSVRAEAYRAGFAAGQNIDGQGNRRQTRTEDVPPRNASATQTGGPSLGDLALGVGLVAAAFAAVAGLAKVLNPNGKTYDSDVSRYRTRDGKFARG